MSGRMAVVLLSGGLDSTTVAAMARAQGWRILALTIDYNQRHRIELDHAARVADAPRANEIVVAVVVTDSGRPLARVGGLKASEIQGVDGLR